MTTLKMRGLVGVRALSEMDMLDQDTTLLTAR